MRTNHHRLLASASIVAAVLLARPAGAAPSDAENPGTAQSLPTQRVVFVCDADGVPEYADRPCGRSATPYAIEFSAGPGQSASVAPVRPQASTRPRVLPATSSAAAAPADRRCIVLRERLAAIDDQMRAGYSAREAARLWQRWRDARARLREQRC